MASDLEYLTECVECGSDVEEFDEECGECGASLYWHASGKRYVLECEFCDRLFASNFKIWNAIKSAIHAKRAHREQMLEKYG